MSEANNQRVAIVTGAARGIGAAVATRLAADGHAVAIVDLDEQSCKSVATAIEDKGGTAVAVAADVSDEQSVTDATAAIADQLGGPTILINNAGITRDNVLRKMSVDDWDAVTAVHLRGNFLFSRAVQPHMREAGWGRIVNLSSVYGLVAPPGQAVYAASKFAVRGFSIALGHEPRETRIGVTVVHPGGVATAIAENARAPRDKPEDGVAEAREQMKRMLKLPPETAGEIIVKGSNAGGRAFWSGPTRS